MYRSTQKTLIQLAEQLSAEDIFTFAGNWSSSTSMVNGLEVTSYRRMINGKEVVFQTLYDPKSKSESSTFQPVSPGSPIGLVHKADFITEFIFDNDLAKAYAWVLQVIEPTNSWLTDLGSQAKNIEGDMEPEVEADEGLLAGLAAEEYLKLKARETAVQRLAEDAYRSEGQTPEPVNVNEWLQEPDVEQEFRIDGLWIKRGTSFVVAQNKAGKTTLVLNAARCLLDGGKFLGRFETIPVNRQLGLVNFELTDAQFKRWVRKLGIQNLQNFRVWNLKGKPNPLRSKASREHFIQQLRGNDIEVLIVDPFSSAFPGDDANKNELVKKFLKELDEIVDRGGVEEFMMVVHAGHDGTRARGASTLADHPDASWFIKKSDSGPQRTFAAVGRDVLVDEEGLTIGEDGVTLKLNGLDPREQNGSHLKTKLITYIASHPDCSAGETDLKVGGSKTALATARKELVESGEITETIVKNAKRYRVAV